MTELISVSQTGTPVVAEQASANVGQPVTLEGNGFDTTTRVVLEAIRGDGLPFIATATPASVAADGASLIFVVSPKARSGQASLLNGGATGRFRLCP